MMTATEDMLAATRQSFTRLTPRYQMRNPVMFTVFVGAIITTLLFGYNLKHSTAEPSWFIAAVAFWLWFTVVFANFAEAIAEGKGRAQAESLKSARRDIPASLQAPDP